MNPKTETIAYRIWAYCTPLGWNCTVNDIASALGISVGKVASILGHKGWQTRLRCPERINVIGLHKKHVSGHWTLDEFDEWGQK